MELLLLIWLLTAAPLAIWIQSHRERWRHPSLAMGIVFAASFGIVFGLANAVIELYPYGLPGHTNISQRVAAEACAIRYADARNSADTAKVDTMVLPLENPRNASSCRVMRAMDLPRCTTGSRCARFKEMLRLPPE